MMTSTPWRLAPGRATNLWGSRLIRLLALVGVPAMAALLTGGLEHTGFWLYAWVLVVAGALALAWATILGSAIIWFPLWLLFGDPLRKWKDEIGAGATVVLAVIFFYGRASEMVAEAPPDLAWPLGPPLAGFLAITIPGMASIVGLFVLARRVKRAPPFFERQAEPLVGWRQWRFVDGVLVGVRAEWDSETLVATCWSAHRVPAWDCTCGIYVWRELSQVPASPGVVTGTVEMWGEVVEHGYGYRTSHARITDLWVGSDQELFLDLTVRYPEVRVWLGSPSPE